jgi:hypothetical protein
MAMNRPLARRARIALPCAALLLGACRDATAPRTEGLPRGLEAGIYPLVRLVAESQSSAQVELYLKRVRTADALSSYQGELTYDPAILTLDHTDLPPGLTGTTYQTAPGRIRFAAAALEGVGDVPLLALRFTRTGQISAATFQVAVEEVTGPGFTDLSAQAAGARTFFERAVR